MQQHQPIELEHRLTVVEITQESHAKLHEDHTERIAELERKQITPRDWLMIAGSVLAVLGALFKKLDLKTAIDLLLQK